MPVGPEPWWIRLAFCRSISDALLRPLVRRAGPPRRSRQAPGAGRGHPCSVSFRSRPLTPCLRPAVRLNDLHPACRPARSSLPPSRPISIRIRSRFLRASRGHRRDLVAGGLHQLQRARLLQGTQRVQEVVLQLDDDPNTFNCAPSPPAGAPGPPACPARPARPTPPATRRRRLVEVRVDPLFQLRERALAELVVLDGGGVLERL